jgi:subtilisin family serine protease
MKMSGIKKQSLAGSIMALVVLLVLFAALAGSGASAQQVPSVAVHGLWPLPAWATASGPGTDAVSGEVLVRFVGGTDRRRVDADAGLVQASVARDLTPRSASVVGPRLYLLKSTSGSAAQLVGRLRAHSEVLQTSPNYLLHVAEVIPNDTLFTQQWDLKNTGQTGGKAGADIHATQAWSVSTGSSSVVVADVDTGINYNHPDLAANVWKNPGEIPGNGIDDDHNGYVDDVYGINPVSGNVNPLDDNGHGSHTAGTMGALGNNGAGVTGVNWNVKLMGLKFLDSSGSGTTADAITCINYAVDMKVNHGINVVAINASWGGGAGDSLLKSAIDAAGAAGIVFVAAAGNSGSNNDTAPFYPAAFTSSNLIAVAATNASDTLPSWSNYGPTSVDLAAPGDSITSTVLNSQYAVYSGTSMATPHVTGAVALLAAVYPSDTAAQRIQRILTSVDPLPSLAGRVATGGRLDLATAVGAAPSISSLNPSSGPTAGGTSVVINGSGFTGLSGPAAVTFGGTNATSYLVNSQTQITAIAPPGAAGTVDVVVTGVNGASATGTADHYTYVAPPTITGLNPTSGSTAGGTSVVINGTNFVGVSGASGVVFGGVNASSYVVNSATQITATAPAHSASTVQVQVTGTGGTTANTAADDYTYVLVLPSPTITGLNPTSGTTAGGTSVVITGTNLSGATGVAFGASASTIFTVNSPTQITATAPAQAAGTVDVVVTTGGGPSATGAADRYTYVAPPTITGLNPTSGTTAGGTSVVIAGTNFVGVSGANGVTFGGTDASSYVVDSATQITAMAPPHAAGAVQVQVIATGGTTANTAADDYTYLTPPSRTRYEQNNGNIAYTGSWSTVTATSASAGSYRRSAMNAASITVYFTGTRFDWITTKNTTTGKADVYLDGVLQTTVNLAASVTTYQADVWSTGNLANSAHNVRIVRNNTNATGSYITLDAADIWGTIAIPPAATARYDQTNSNIRYTGTWATFTTTSAYGGSYGRSATSGASTTIYFTGTRLDWIATMGTTTSKADVYLDGVLQTTIDLAASVVAYKVDVWSTGPLANGAHNVRIVRTSTDVSGKYITLDAVDIWGSITAGP